MIRASALSLALVCLQTPDPQTARAGEKKDLSEKESAALTKQRDLADAFMRSALELALKRTEASLKDAKAGKDQRKQHEAAKEMLQKQLSQKRIFATGTKTEELLDFARWLKEADAAGIKLTEQGLQELIKASAAQRLDDKTIKKLAEELGKQQETTAEAVLQAVSAEFRARIARDLAVKKKK